MEASKILTSPDMKRLQSVPRRAGRAKSPTIARSTEGIGTIWGLLLATGIAVAACREKPAQPITRGAAGKTATKGATAERRAPPKPASTRQKAPPKPVATQQKAPPKPAPARPRGSGPYLSPGEGGDERTVPWVVERLGPAVGPALKARCGAKKIAWPPARLTILAFKRERRMEVWGANASGPFAMLKSYTILAASGGMGPKRREGDLQVPEGFYRLPELNPRSSYHLSIRVDYPNGDDIAHAAVARGDMGGDIYIHGSDVSIGCMALGDRAIEEVFLMAAMVPESSRRIIIAPYDFRRSPRAPLPRSEGWVAELYKRIIAELRGFPRSRA
jgi:hypothetical protein